LCVLSPYRKTSALRDVLYALSMSAEERSGPVIAGEIGRSPASVYPILARLESAGWVDSRWAARETCAGARQRLYQLSAHGVVAARRHGARGRAGRWTRRDPASVLHLLPRARWVSL
jgi:DNA-binding PadR family transcriptional regulator